MRCLAKLPWKVGLFVALGCCASYLFFGGAGLQSRRDDLAAAAVVSWKKYLEIGGGGPAALGEPTCDGDLVIGVLETWYLSWRKQHARALEQRSSIRRTWARLSPAPFRGTILFVVGVYNETGVPQEYAAEAALYRDMLFIPVNEPHPANLGEKVAKWFQWVSQRCANARYVMKTNEDAFVHMPQLATALGRLPSQGLVFGRLMGKAERWALGAAPRSNPYPNGCGYVVTRDVVALIAGRPPDERGLSEDSYLGRRLVGRVAHAVRANSQFQSLGRCESPDTILLHYQRHTALMQRRYARAIAGRSICGEGFQKNELCVRAANGGRVATKCPAGQKIQHVHYAAFCAVGQWEGPEFPWCAEEPAAVVEHDPCCAEGTRDIVLAACIGKAACNISVSPNALGGDPCPRRQKHLYALLQCE